MIASFCTSKLEEFPVILQFQPHFVLVYCVSHLVFSLVATLGNLLVILALWKASSIPANLKRFFLSLTFSDLAVGLYVQPMFGIIIAVILLTVSGGNYNLNRAPNKKILAKYLKCHFLLSQIVSELFKGTFV